MSRRYALCGGLDAFAAGGSMNAALTGDHTRAIVVVVCAGAALYLLFVAPSLTRERP